jgi:hypothetical protein
MMPWIHKMEHREGGIFVMSQNPPPVDPNLPPDPPSNPPPQQPPYNQSQPQQSWGWEDDRRSRRHGGNSSTWIWAFVLIAVGVVFLLQNTGTIAFGHWNWWALFILIPAVGSFASAFSMYRAEGKVSSAARGSLIGGFVLLAVAVMFLFDLDWGKWWPIFLIIGGLGALAGSFWRN